jgi:hypothetical protein
MNTAEILADCDLRADERFQLLDAIEAEDVREVATDSLLDLEQ